MFDTNFSVWGQFTFLPSACDCNIWGSNSTDCDKETGQCECLEGNTGQQCDICGEWAVVTAEGCENCTGCTAILRDYIGELSDEIGETIRAKEAGGRISQDIEELIDMKNTAILLKVIPAIETMIE